MGRIRFLVGIGSLVAILTLPLVSCEEDCPSEPQGLKGELAGRITAIGEPVQARVFAWYLSDSGGPYDRYCYRETVRTDSSGAYSLSLAAGRYVVSVRLEDVSCCVDGMISGGSVSYTEADTFVVKGGGEALRADVRFGSVDLRVGLPPQLEGKSVRMYLMAVDSDELTSVEATMMNGKADFVFPAVIPGRYRMRLVTTSTSIWLPSTYSESAADIITVVVDRRTTYEADIPSRGMVYGSMTGAWQQMNLLRPQLLLVDADSTLIASNTLTWEGLYQLWVFAPVRVRMMIDVEGTHVWYGASDFAHATEIDLEPGQQTEINISDSGITGELGRSPGGSRSTKSTVVNLYDEAGLQLGSSVARGGRGMFQFAGLSPGVYFLQIGRGSSWIPHWFNGADSYEEATPIEITSQGEVLSVGPTLLDGARVAGRVIDSHGEGISGAPIELRSTAGSEYGDVFEVANASGDFELIAISDGAYHLGVHDSRRGMLWYPGVADVDSAGVITIAHHADVTGIELRYR